MDDRFEWIVSLVVFGALAVGWVIRKLAAAGGGRGGGQAGPARPGGMQQAGQNLRDFLKRIEQEMAGVQQPHRPPVQPPARPQPIGPQPAMHRPARPQPIRPQPAVAPPRRRRPQPAARAVPVPAARVPRPPESVAEPVRTEEAYGVVRAADIPRKTSSTVAAYRVSRAADIPTRSSPTVEAYRVPAEARGRARLVLPAGTGLRDAVVWAEVLGKPVALRRRTRAAKAL